MGFSLPFAIPAMAERTYLPAAKSFEIAGFRGLLLSMAICMVVGLLFRMIGRGQRTSQLYQKEAMAIVGLSWVLATVLGGATVLSQRYLDRGRPSDHVHRSDV